MTHTADQIALIEAGIAAGETAIFIGYSDDEMAIYYMVGGI